MAKRAVKTHSKHMLESCLSLRVMVPEAHSVFLPRTGIYILLMVIGVVSEAQFLVETRIMIVAAFHL